MKLAFITGISGQDGYYLSKLLLTKKYKVYGIVRRTSELYCSSRIKSIEENIILKYGDLTDPLSLMSVVSDIIKDNPEFEVMEIYNLGAQSHVSISFEIPNYTTEVDAIGALNILEIIKQQPEYIQKKMKFYQAGTSELYGRVLETPQKETTPFNPISPYAAAKQYAYQMTKIYREGYGIYAVNGILFNHESPKRAPNFVTMKIINAMKDIENGTREYVEVGNIYSKRDWGHAEDYVNGMWLMMQNKTPTDYVLATGKTYTVKEFIEKAFLFKKFKIHWKNSGTQEIGIDQNGITRVKISEKFYRPCEVDLLLGDSSKAQRELGWSLKYKNLDDIIEDMFT
jgi:GDPmannose 4,6-dehydratase